MAEESKIRDESGKLIAVRTTEEYNGGTREITQEATMHWGTELRGKIQSDIDRYPDGTEYEHKGARRK